MSFSGFRGAIAFALAIDSVEEFGSTGKVILTVTICFAILTVIGGGLFIQCLLRKLGLLYQEETEEPEPGKCVRYLKSFEHSYIYPCLVKPAPQDPPESESQLGDS